MPANLNYNKKLELLDWNFDDSSSELIHSIHPYPAKFIPSIPRLLIKTLPIPQNTIILDPFCGSGVTLVEAQNAGIESLGVDLNPIACLISKVKVQPLDKNFLTTAKSVFEKSKSYHGNITIPEIPNLDHWFKKDIQNALAILLKQINLITDTVISDALKFCFSSIIVKVSNQDSDTRYAAIDKRWGKNNVFDFFIQSCEKLHNAKAITKNCNNSKVITHDSLHLNEITFPKKIGLVITSPPYPNAYEYWLYHKYRMWWLGFDPIEVKRKEIGARAHYFSKNHQTEFDFISQMELLFSFLRDSCAKNAFVCFIIGRSKIHGRIIDNEKIIESIGLKNNFSHIITKIRTIKSNRKSFNLSHARIKEEYIVVLQK